MINIWSNQSYYNYYYDINNVFFLALTDHFLSDLTDQFMKNQHQTNWHYLNTDLLTF